MKTTILLAGVAQLWLDAHSWASLSAGLINSIYKSFEKSRGRGFDSVKAEHPAPGI